MRLTRHDVRDHINYRKTIACALKSLVRLANALHLRDFRSPAIFEFFNTIGTYRTWRLCPVMSVILGAIRPANWTLVHLAWRAR